MPLFRAQATIFTIDAKKSDASIAAFHKREMYGAMRAFLAAALRRIPVRTGFLRGAFEPMREFYSRGAAGPDLDPGQLGVARPAQKKRRLEWYYTGPRQRVPKVPHLARRFTKPDDPARAIDISGDTAVLKFDVDIIYYRVNDFYSRVTGSPWRSMDAGFQAALTYLEKAVSRYDYLSEVFVAQQIFLRGNLVGKTQAAGNQAADYRGRFLPPSGAS